MPKYCSSCGAANQNGAAVCFRCRRPLNPSGTPLPNNQNSRNRRVPNIPYQAISNPQSRAVQKSPKLIFALIGGVAIIGILSAIILTIGKILFPSAPSERWIAENVPQELKAYLYEGDEYMSEVDSVIINKEYTNDDICIQECTVCLTNEDNCLTRTVYLHLEAAKMDSHKFYLNSWSETKPETYTCSQELGEQKAEAYIENNEYRLGEPHYSFDEDNTMITATYSADADYTYLNVSGTVKYTSHLSGQVDIGNYPHEFTWKTDDFDVSSVTSKWKIAGDWSGETDEYRVNIHIEKANGNNSWSWSGKAYYYTYDGRERFYPGEGTLSYDNTQETFYNFYEIKNSSDICSPKKAHLPFVLDFSSLPSGWAHLKITFTPEAATIAMANGDNAQALIKR